MKKFFDSVKSFARNDEGAALVEYAMLVGLIAVGALVAVQTAGGNVQSVFQTIADKLGSIETSIQSGS